MLILLLLLIIIFIFWNTEHFRSGQIYFGRYGVPVKIPSNINNYTRTSQGIYGGLYADLRADQYLTTDLQYGKYLIDLQRQLRKNQFDAWKKSERNIPWTEIRHGGSVKEIPLDNYTKLLMGKTPEKIRLRKPINELIN